MKIYIPMEFATPTEDLNKQAADLVAALFKEARFDSGLALTVSEVVNQYNEKFRAVITQEARNLFLDNMKNIDPEDDDGMFDINRIQDVFWELDPIQGERLIQRAHLKYILLKLAKSEEPLLEYETESDWMNTGDTWLPKRAEDMYSRTDISKEELKEKLRRSAEILQWYNEYSKKVDASGVLLQKPPYNPFRT